MSQRTAYIFLFISLTQSFIASMGRAQSGLNKDSILRIIQQTRYDSVRVLSLLDYGGIFAYENPDTAQYYYRLAKELTQKIKFERGFQKYVSYQTEIYNIQGKFDSSLQLNKEGLAIARNSNDKVFIGTHLSNCGNVFLYQGINDSAASYFMQATRYFEELKDSMKLGILYSNLGIVFSNLRQPNRVIHYNQQAILMAEASGDQLGVGYASVNLGAEYKRISKYDSARYFLEKGLAIANDSKVLDLEKDALVSLGFTQIKLGDEAKAERYFLRALELSRLLKSDYGIVTSFEGLASIFYQRKDYLTSKRYLNEAIELAVKGSFNEELKNLYLLQYETEQSLGNHKQALDAYRQYTALKDSMSNVDIQKNISLLDQQYQAERKEKMLLQKDLEINTQKVLLQNKNAWVIISTGAAALMLLLAFAAWGYFRQRRKADQRDNELKQLQLSYSVKEEERNRIAGELHDDIGATLSSIHIYSSVAEKSLKENPEKTKVVLQQINNTTRQVMENMSDIVWAMKQEQAGEKSFASRIKNYGYDLLTTKNVECDYQIDENAENLLQNVDAKKNILLIVKEAMNNISKYSEATKAEIKMRADITTLYILIRDNGKGFQVGGNNQGNGLGNMKSRTYHLGGKFSLQSEPGRGTRVEFSLPLTRISDPPIVK